jgi:hypothetical protein
MIREEFLLSEGEHRYLEYDLAARTPAVAAQLTREHGWTSPRNCGTTASAARVR